MTAVHSQRLTLTLSADWFDGPFWLTSDSGDYRGPHDLEEIKDVVELSEELLADVAAWDKTFRDAYNPDVPQDSGMASIEEQKEFDERGRALAHRIRLEVPESVEVRYQPLAAHDMETIRR